MLHIVYKIFLFQLVMTKIRSDLLGWACLDEFLSDAYFLHVCVCMWRSECFDGSRHVCWSIQITDWCDKRVLEQWECWCLWTHGSDWLWFNIPQPTDPGYRLSAILSLLVGTRLLNPDTPHLSYPVPRSCLRWGTRC